jgi:hypothetical protein
MEKINTEEIKKGTVLMDLDMMNVLANLIVKIKKCETIEDINEIEKTVMLFDDMINIPLKAKKEEILKSLIPYDKEK